MVEPAHLRYYVSLCGIEVAMAQRCIDGGEVTIGEHVLPIEIRVNPRAQRLILRLSRERKITVTCPTRRHVTQARKMVEDQKRWLLDQLDDAPPPVPLALGEVLPVFGEDRVVVAADKPTSAGQLTAHRIIVGGRDDAAIHRRIEALLRRKVRQTISEEVARMGSVLGVKASKITIKQMTSRWGSCTADKVLCFNWRLVFAPRHILSYVVAHEVAHLREMNHSPAFWREVEKLYPDYKTATAWLNAHGAQLHAFGQSLPDTKKAA